MTLRNSKTVKLKIFVSLIISERKKDIFKLFLLDDKNHAMQHIYSFITQIQNVIFFQCILLYVEMYL